MNQSKAPVNQIMFFAPIFREGVSKLSVSALRC